MPAPSLLDQLWSTPVPPKAVPRRDPNGPIDEDEVRTYLSNATQNYPNFSRAVKFDPEAFRGWLSEGPQSLNIEDRREPPHRSGRLRIGSKSYGAD